MNFLSRAALFAVGSLLLAACTVEEKGPTPSAPGTPGAAAPQAPAPVPDAAPDLPAIQSQAEADAKAAATISKENADLELEKLKKELGGG